MLRQKERQTERQTERQKKISAYRIVFALTALMFSVFSTSAAAEFVVSRAFQSATNAEFERLFINEVTSNGQSVSVGPATMLNPPLLDRQSIWTFVPVRNQNQIVYGAFDPEDGAALDDLFVVDFRLPGRARQLNPPRSDPANQIITGLAATGDHPRVVYTFLDFATGQQTLFVADSRNPGTASLVTTLGAGEQFETALVLSPDVSMVAYSVSTAAGNQELRLSFLNRPANSSVVHSNPALTNYQPTELAFSDDSSRLVWIDSGSQNEPGPLQSTLLDALTGTVGSVTQLSAGGLENERVSEFAIQPGTNNMVAYRGFAAGSVSPSNTFLADANSPGTVTQLNNAAPTGAAFTTFEDVEWRDNTVLYNSAEDMPLRADLFSVAAGNPGDPALLTRQVPFSTDRPSSRASAISHFIQSPDSDNTAMIDGDPAINLFVIDRFNIGTSFQPFDINSNRELVSSTDPNNLPPQFSPGSDMLAMVIAEDLPGSIGTNNLYVANATANASDVPVLQTESPMVFAHEWFDADAVISSEPTALAAAILPASRSGQVGSDLTAFVTLINGGSVAAEDCTIDLLANIPATLTYQTTDRLSNEPTGSPNTPTTIPPAPGSQSFVVTLSLDAEFEPVDALLAYSCANADTVTPLAGLNTLLLSASTTPVPDVIALAATVDGDGVVRLDSAGNGAFSVASVNVGTTATISVSATTSTGASVALCESDPATAACINPTSPTFGDVSVDISNNGTPTFSIFASSGSPIASNAATNRIGVVFRDSTGNVRGQTSVAVETDG